MAVNQAQSKRIPRSISETDKEYVLSLKREDITYDLLKNLFAFKENSKGEQILPRFLTNDNFTLNKNTFHNENSVKTTVGRYIYNLFIYSEKILNFIGYQNEPMNKKNIGRIEGLLSNLLLDDKITTDDVIDYIDRIQWLGFRISKFIDASLTYNLLVPEQSIEDKKKELLEKYKDAIENNDIVGIAKLEQELIEFSKNINQDLPDMDIYDSGGRGSYNNNYKNTSLMRGVLRNMGSGEVITSTSSLVDGINPDEMPMYADLMTQATSSRAIGTQEGGYEAKKMSTAFQDIILDEAGSDCGTDLTLDIKITNSNKKLFSNRYIVDDKNKELILLTNENIDKYVNKKVHMRSPMFCNGEKFCSKCMGEFYYKLGIKNIGLIMQRTSTRILNLALKKMHDMSIDVVSFDIDDYID